MASRTDGRQNRAELGVAADHNPAPTNSRTRGRSQRPYARGGGGGGCGAPKKFLVSSLGVGGLDWCGLGWEAGMDWQSQ